VRIYRDPAELLAEPAERAVTIGAFDGVHLGHQAVLRLVHDLARARGLLATVLTFDKHPAEVVRPESAPKLLTTLEQKLELLDATGAVDECVVLPFDLARSKEPAEQFVEELLASALHARLVVVGADFHFGYHRHGDVPLLQRMGAELGFETIGLGLVAPSGGAVGVPYSSTRVREVLASGDVERANAILGRPHELRVAIRDGRAQVPDRCCVPAPGRYRVDVDGRAAEARVEVGNNIVFDDPVPDAAEASIKFLARA